MLKRMSVILLILSFTLTLFVIPVAATDYTVSTSDERVILSSNSATGGEDYVFTLSEDTLIVAYAEFEDGSILTYTLCSGTHNYFDDVVWNKGDEEVVPECMFELCDFSFTVGNDEYTIKFEFV